MGNLLAQQGDVPGARAAYQKAIDSRHESWAPIAVNRLRDVLRDQGTAELLVSRRVGGQIPKLMCRLER